MTFLVWGGVAASAVYWGLKMGSASGDPIGAAPAARAVPAPDLQAIARLLGASGESSPAAAPAPGASLAGRFSLQGVVAERGERGAALLAVDGRPARPYRVGTQVDEGVVLQSVQPRRAVLAASMDGPALLTLELPSSLR